jgi:hypothetical protein
MKKLVLTVLFISGVFITGVLVNDFRQPWAAFLGLSCVLFAYPFINILFGDKPDLPPLLKTTFRVAGYLGVAAVLSVLYEIVQASNMLLNILVGIAFIIALWCNAYFLLRIPVIRKRNPDTFDSEERRNIKDIHFVFMSWPAPGLAVLLTIVFSLVSRKDEIFPVSQFILDNAMPVTSFIASVFIIAFFFVLYKYRKCSLAKYHFPSTPDLYMVRYFNIIRYCVIACIPVIVIVSLYSHRYYLLFPSLFVLIPLFYLTLVSAAARKPAKNDTPRFNGFKFLVFSNLLSFFLSGIILFVINLAAPFIVTFYYIFLFIYLKVCPG